MISLFAALAGMICITNSLVFAADSNDTHCGSQAAVADADAVSKSVARAFALFQANQFAAAADAFEPVLRSASVHPPDARTLYYAALANQQSGRAARAKQLLEYIVASYPSTTEAKYAQVILARAPREKVVVDKPPHDEIDAASEKAKSQLSKENQALLETPEGKAALRQATQAAIQSANGQPGITQVTGAKALASAASPRTASTGAASDRPFTAGDIARDGAAGVDQSRYPNCWFEASLSALAALPRGQRLIASMIRKLPGNKYVVRFPSDGNEYMVTKQEMIENGVNDNALWAAIIECAEIKKYPENAGTEGLNRLEVGLSCISGLKAEVLDPSHSSEAELSSFIGGPIRSQNPIVCATGYLSDLPEIVFAAHAYTITGFDPSRNMITLRNPHGRRAQSFAPLPDDPQQLHFQQLGGGVCKMDIATFQKYFRSIARSFI
jgi:tetratricopeptide (TPR) repeat protein